MKKAILLSLLLLTACTNSKDVEKYAKKEGWKAFEVTGYKIFECSKDDFYHTGFKATTKDGVEITGVVCGGLFFKGATLRLD